MVGKTLGHYEILEPLGAGGMGEVYRARDTTLKRDVAIKVLPDDLSADPDRLARLEREAHLLAALNHPNIATIHALEEDQGARFLVLELVKGESLEQRLAKGALPVEKALEFCKQIAEALEAAHGEGIIHRDLKPANVLITPDGRAKVLDFGLAKPTAATGGGSEADMSHSPTVTVMGTQAGVILGTAPYMSPEQVRGGAVDKRTDIWAFGCVLYEALTGKRAFDRETVADTLAAIIEVEPDLDLLPTATPSSVRILVRRCLRKEVKLRVRDIGDAWVELDDAMAGPGEAAPAELVRRRSQERLWWGLAVVLAAVVTAAVASFLRPSAAPPRALTRFTVSLPGGYRLVPTATSLPMTVSPDGGRIVYSAVDANGDVQLYLRELNKFDARAIRGT